MSDDKPVHMPGENGRDVVYPPPLSTPIRTYRLHRTFSLRDRLCAIRQRRWRIVAVSSTTVIVMILWTFMQTRIYRATATIEIGRTGEITDSEVETQAKLLSAPSVARDVIQDLELESVAELAEPIVTDGADPPRHVIDTYMARLHVARSGDSEIFLSFDSADPELAARVVNAHAGYFIKENLSAPGNATPAAMDVVSVQLSKLKGRIEDFEQRLQDYGKANGIVFNQQSESTAKARLGQFEREHVQRQAERSEKESYYRLAQSQDYSAFPQVLSSPVIASLSTRLGELTAEESRLAVNLTPQHPRLQQVMERIKDVEQSIQNEKERLAAMAQTEYAAAVEQERLARQELDRQKILLQGVDRPLVPYNILKRDLDASKELFENLRARLKEAGADGEPKASNIRVVDPAEIPRRPLQRLKLANLGLSLATGLLAGLLATQFPFKAA